MNHLKIDVSIIIINYNTFLYTKNCINSIFKKTQQINFEIILVDNGSTERLEHSFVDLFPSIKYIYLSENVGFSKANNIGINEAFGDVILLLNSDTLLVNDSISICYNTIKDNLNIGVVGAKLLNSDGSFQISTKRYPSILKEILIISKLYRIFNFYTFNVEFGIIEPKNVFSTDYLIGAFFMFRKSDLLNFPQKKLHEDFFMYVEDIQWCYYFKKILNKNIIYNPEAIVIHHGSVSSSLAYNRTKFSNIILPNIFKFILMFKGPVYLFFYKLLVKLRFKIG